MNMNAVVNGWNITEAKAFHPTRSARNHLKILATAGSVPLSRVDEVWI